MASSYQEFSTGNNASTIISINGKKFLSGMLWQPLNSASSAKREAAKFARDQGMNLYVIYSGMSVQGGFATVAASEIKKCVGTYSLATVLASELGESWFGVFDIDETNSVMVAVDNGKIIPGCDIIGSRAEIHNAARRAVSAFVWKKIFCEDDDLRSVLGAESADRRSLAEILADKRISREHKIVSPMQSNTRMIILLSILCGTMVAGWFGYQWVQKDAARKVAEMQEMARRAVENQKKKTDRALALEELKDLQPKPEWPFEPQPLEVVRVCGDAFSKVRISIGGWRLKEASCTGQALSVSYGRVLGLTMLDFHDAAERMKNEKDISSFMVMPDTGRVTILIDKLDPRGVEELTKEKDFTIRWISFFQGVIGVTTEYREKPKPKPAEPKPWIKQTLGEKEAIPQPAWWDTYTWSLSTSNMNGLDVMKSVPRAPGFVIKKIQLNVADDISGWKWTAEGEVHVKP